MNTCTWCRRGCYYYLCCCCAVSAVWRGRVTSAVPGFLHPPPRPSPSLTVSAGSGTIASPVIAKHTEEFCQFTIPFFMEMVCSDDLILLIIFTVGVAARVSCVARVFIIHDHVLMSEYDERSRMLPTEY